MSTKSKTCILVLASILLWPTGILAQNIIHGKVFESATGTPLQGASVTVKGTTVTILTNADGAFSLPVNKTNPKLEVSFVGYLSQTVNATDNKKRSLLLIATNNGHIEMATLLIEHGADVNQQADNQDSPFLYAGASGQTELVKLFLRKAPANPLVLTALLRIRSV